MLLSRFLAGGEINVIFVMITMKRILSIIIAFTYLSTSVGATVHLHYCMGKLISWDFNGHDSKKCDVCGMQKENGKHPGLSSNKNCCRDENKTIATGSDRKTADIEYQFAKSFSGLSILYFKELPSSGASFTAIEYPKTNAPPFKDGQPLFMLNRNFRI
jgi:hypothetical protein